MKSRVNDRLLDDLLGAYIDWRERSRRAEVAYSRWSSTQRADSTARFADYSAAVDEEEASANRYAELVRQVSQAKSGAGEQTRVGCPASTCP